MAEKSKIEIRPQRGPQTAFLSTAADIAFYGGAAGGGKTFALLLEPLRHYDNPKFGAVIFRRTHPQIMNEGGLWDTSMDVYMPLGARPRESLVDWTFPSGMAVSFRQMEHEKDRFQWQGSQIPLIGFDEVTHFTRKQFFYMLSRNRSTSGVPGYIRATCNPDPDSWVKEFIAWWIDPQTGLPIPARSGKLRWFIMRNDSLIWADTKRELEGKYPGSIPKSVTFIGASVTDNKILMKTDPAYMANLEALPLVEREQLRNGNWNIRPAPGLVFKRRWFEIVDAPPADAKRVRYWDRAATEKTEANNPDWTAGCKMSKDSRGVYYVEDMNRFQAGPLAVEKEIKNTASHDGLSTEIGLEQDPGQAGKVEVRYQVRLLAPYIAWIFPATKSKLVRAKGVSAQAEAGNVKVVRGAWNEDFFNELEAFPDETEKAKDDQVDALSGAFNMLQGEAPKPEMQWL